MSSQNQDIKAILSSLSLEEKASLCSGKDFWTTKPIERLDIPSIWMADGPHGLRRAPLATGVGIGNSIPATCFPTASALAASWDTELTHEVGAALGKEAQAQQVQIVLGPGVNMKRSPLGGRNFEYYAEDPVLSGEMAAAFVNGVQSQGVGTCVKHFVANNQEYQRWTISAEIDERALREIYLRSFEIIVKKSQPWTMMTSYNRVNGTFVTESYELQHKILKEEWAYEGFLISDWGAVYDRVASVKGALHLEMPGGIPTNDQLVLKALKSGQLAEEELDTLLEDFLKIVFKAHTSRKEDTSFDAQAHHQLARKVAGECIVLLKNDNNILPLNPSQTGRIAVIGDMAKNPRYQGAGSSQVVPTQLETAWEELQKLAGDQLSMDFAQGYGEEDIINEELIVEAQNKAQQSDIAIVFAGLPESYESEGADREHLELPQSHQALIRSVADVQPNLIVVLCNGSAVGMHTWHQAPQAILEAWLGGQASGGAIADILFGKVNPSGKLSETFPKRIEDTPAYINWPGEAGQVKYGEGLYIGYRYYDTKGLETQFPFGHGLSYTEFNYSNLEFNSSSIRDSDGLELKFKLQNAGERSGKEVVQVYVREVNPRLNRPVKELKAFTKIELAPGETKDLSLNLDQRAFAYWDTELGDWRVDSGEFDILVGSSATDIRLEARVTVEASRQYPAHFTKYTELGQWLAHPLGKELAKTALAPVMATFVNQEDSNGDSEEDMSILTIMESMPMIKFVSQSFGALTEEMVDEMVQKVNQ